MKYGGMAFQMGMTIFLCVFLGKKLDNYFELSPPYLTATLAIVGVFLAMFLVIRQLMADQKQ